MFRIVFPQQKINYEVHKLWVPEDLFQAICSRCTEPCIHIQSRHYHTVTTLPYIYLICIGATATLPQATIQLQIIMPQNFENGYLDMHAYTCEQILGGVGHGFKSVAYRTARRRNQGRNAYLGKRSTLAYLELHHDALSPW